MNKVFYNPETLEIKGWSDGAITMDFPYVETEYSIVLFHNFEVVKNKKGVVELKPKKMQFTEAEWEKETKA